VLSCRLNGEYPNQECPLCYELKDNNVRLELPEAKQYYCRFWVKAAKQLKKYFLAAEKDAIWLPCLACGETTFREPEQPDPSSLKIVTVLWGPEK